MTETAYDSLSNSFRALLREAEQAMETAYSPYSGFRVGAALLSEDGKVFRGCNVENASYGLSLCAERSALAQAYSQGCRDFSALAIISSGAAGASGEPTTPCGACRQVLFEAAQFAGRELSIILSNTQKTCIQMTSIRELLPHAFGSGDLGQTPPPG